VIITINQVNVEKFNVLPIEGRNKLFNEYLLNEFDNVIVNRKEAIKKALLSKENVQEYQSQLYKNYVTLFGEFPEKLPLNAEVVSTISTNDGYRIEKLYYQSRPNHHITANLYIPETGVAPYPAVAVLCGHYPDAKSTPDYQNLSILLSKNGIAAFIIDPICQGERCQLHDREGRLTQIGTSGTSSLSRLDVGASLNGSSVAAHLLWDNHRGIDYLFTRTDVVDTSKIGCAGHSGGGAQATNLLAFDKRLKAGTVANYISNETRTFKELQPQVASQNLAFEGVFGFDQASYIELFAPKPFMIIATTTDFFPIEGSRETFAEVQHFYDILGAKEKVTLFETQDVHDYTKIKREATVRWFKRWFTGNNDSVIEANQKILPVNSLHVTSTGYVYTNFPREMTVQDINLEIALKDSVNRKNFWENNPKDSCLNMVKHLIRLKVDYEPPVSEIFETIDRDTYTIDKIKITSGNNIPITGLLFKPKNLLAKAPATLYLKGDGKGAHADVGGIIEEFYVNKGTIVFAVDVRGFGETSDADPSDFSKHGNNEFRNNMISLYLGKPLIGQRVEDIMKATTIMLKDTDVDPDRISLEGLGRAATAALHAAALDIRIKRVVLRNTIKSMIELIEDPSILNGMTHQVNSALKYYDLPDLVNSISPRVVSFEN
jgi:cephalosporin-C deacetylase-like acetyl esterase